MFLRLVNDSKYNVEQLKMRYSKSILDRYQKIVKKTHTFPNRDMRLFLKYKCKLQNKII